MRWVVFCFSLNVALILAASAQEPVSPDGAQLRAEMKADLEALSAPQFSAREAAAKRLLARKLDSVPFLIELAQAGPVEASVRAFDLLRQLYREGDDATNEAIELAFEDLAQSENPTVALRAEAAIEAGGPIRRAKAIAAFQKVGGVLKYHTDAGIGQPRGDETVKSISHAILDPKSWNGGDDGLKFLRRIDDFRMPADGHRSGLIVIKGSKVSKQAIEDLQIALPSLLVQERGPAQLGVSPYSIFGGPARLQIGDVKAGSAAERAGLRVGDLLLKFNGHAVPDFETLVERISEKEPGDKVPVVYERNGTEATVIVELQGWD